MDGINLGLVLLALVAADPLPTDLTAIQSRGSLRVIVAADEAPETFSVRPGPDPVFERELLEGFAKLRGMTLGVVIAKGYAERIPMLLRDEGDVIAAIFDTEDRRRQVDFTIEVMPTHNVAVTLKPRGLVASVEELREQRVGVIKGTKQAEEVLRAGVPSAAMLSFERREELMAALEKGAVTACVRPISELTLAAKTLPGLQAGVTIGARGTIAWAVRKEDGQLQRALDEYLTNVRRSPSWSRLVVKYFGDRALQVLGRAH